MDIDQIIDSLTEVDERKQIRVDMHFTHKRHVIKVFAEAFASVARTYENEIRVTDLVSELPRVDLDGQRNSWRDRRKYQEYNVVISGHAPDIRDYLLYVDQDLDDVLS